MNTARVGKGGSQEYDWQLVSPLQAAREKGKENGYLYWG